MVKKSMGGKTEIVDESGTVNDATKTLESIKNLELIEGTGHDCTCLECGSAYLFRGEPSKTQRRETA